MRMIFPTGIALWVQVGPEGLKCNFKPSVQQLGGRHVVSGGLFPPLAGLVNNSELYSNCRPYYNHLVEMHEKFLQKVSF